PAAAGGECAGAARADRRRASQRSLPGRRGRRREDCANVSALAFSLPSSLEAAAPPEARGIDRDAVRMLVANRDDGSLVHTRFHRLPRILAPADLVVVNVSGTLAAAAPGRRSDGSSVRVHFATRAPELDESWRVVELRSADGARPERGRAGERVDFEGDGALGLVAAYASGSRLLLRRLPGAGPAVR